MNISKFTSKILSKISQRLNTSIFELRLLKWNDISTQSEIKFASQRDFIELSKSLKSITISDCSDNLSPLEKESMLSICHKYSAIIDSIYSDKKYRSEELRLFLQSQGLKDKEKNTLNLILGGFEFSMNPSKFIKEFTSNIKSKKDLSQALDHTLKKVCAGTSIFEHIKQKNVARIFILNTIIDSIMAIAFLLCLLNYSAFFAISTGLFILANVIFLFQVYEISKKETQHNELQANISILGHIVKSLFYYIGATASRTVLFITPFLYLHLTLSLLSFCINLYHYAGKRPKNTASLGIKKQFTLNKRPSPARLSRSSKEDNTYALNIFLQKKYSAEDLAKIEKLKNALKIYVAAEILEKSTLMESTSMSFDIDLKPIESLYFFLELIIIKGQKNDEIDIWEGFLSKFDPKEKNVLCSVLSYFMIAENEKTFIDSCVNEFLSSQTLYEAFCKILRYASIKVEINKEEKKIKKKIKSVSFYGNFINLLSRLLMFLKISGLNVLIIYGWFGSTFFLFSQLLSLYNSRQTNEHSSIFIEQLIKLTLQTLLFYINISFMASGPGVMATYLYTTGLIAVFIWQVLKDFILDNNFEIFKKAKSPMAPPIENPKRPTSNSSTVTEINRIREANNIPGNVPKLA